MKIEYLHASKYGNGAMVAEEFSKQMAAKGVTVHVHHIREASCRRPIFMCSARLRASASRSAACAGS